MQTKTGATRSRRAARAQAQGQSHPSAFLPSNEAIERALLTGEHGEALAEYFGGTELSRLYDLARQAHNRSLRSGERILILPGLMGTKLGLSAGGLLGVWGDLIWLDPVALANGRLAELAMPPGQTSVAPLGVMLLYYLKLKLRLRAAGFAAEFYPYDWRQGLEVLGANLAGRIAGESAGRIHLIAHSLGGLVARAALRRLERRRGGDAKVGRLVMLGTPNYGSFVATQAFRGTLDTIRLLAAFDLTHSVGELCEGVFNTMPGLYHLLPAREKFAELDLYDPGAWPRGAPSPRAALLQRARATQSLLAAPDGRFHLIAGVGQRTVVDLSRRGEAFEYRQSIEGDGTVPLALARLEGASTHLVEESHGRLPNNARVARAIIELLDTGAARALATQWSPPYAEPETIVSEADLRQAVGDAKRDVVPTVRETQGLLERFLSSEAHETAPPANASWALRLESLCVGRRRSPRLDICLTRGSIADVGARAIVLGLFREVAPEGAASALDQRLGGAIGEFTARRMFGGDLGEVFVLPTGRHPVRADLVMFVGLGTFDRFNEEVLELAAENAIRTLVRADVADLATVLLGGRSGPSVDTLLEHMLKGFLRGLLDADDDRRFRQITLCEFEPGRFEEIKRELFRLAGTPLFGGVEVTFDERILPQPTVSPGAPAWRGLSAPPGAAVSYLIVRQEGQRAGRVKFRSSLLTAGAKATVVTGERWAAQEDVDRLLADLGSRTFTAAKLPAYGQRLGQLVLADEVLAVLPSVRGQHLAVVHDAATSRLPWETLCCGDWQAALEGGMSRRYLADNMSVARWLEERRANPVLEVLLVVNPTEDLSGAEAEGRRIATLFGSHPSVRLTRREGRQASRSTLLDDFRSGRYDMLHYAGHAAFDPVQPARSGILCAGEEILSGADLSGLANLPNLVVFNACESGRVRRRRTRAGDREDLRRRVQQTVGLAEAYLRGGVANYVGTYWPVGDDPAKTFAASFYGAILEGHSLGRALITARLAVHDLPEKSVDWADYIHYGNPHFVLKLR